MYKWVLSERLKVRVIIRLYSQQALFDDQHEVNKSRSCSRGTARSAMALEIVTVAA